MMLQRPQSVYSTYIHTSTYVIILNYIHIHICRNIILNMNSFERFGFFALCHN